MESVLQTTQCILEWATQSQQPTVEEILSKFPAKKPPEVLLFRQVAPSIQLAFSTIFQKCGIDEITVERLEAGNSFAKKYIISVAGEAKYVLRILDHETRASVDRLNELGFHKLVSDTKTGTCSRGVALSLGSAGCKDLSLKE